MPRPFGSRVVLPDDLRQQLQALAHARATPQGLAFRCRIILRAAQADRPTNQQMAAEFDCDRHTVGHWRERFVVAGLAGLQDAPRSGRPRSFSPDERLAVVTLATSTTQEHDQPATRWTLSDLAAAIINDAHGRAMSRATLWRILDDADLKPHQSVYWLNSHDPDFEAKAQAIGRLYVAAPRLYQQGQLLICCDEKTGMQILQRKYPTQPAQPGRPEKREFEYIRHGTRALIASFVVPTGEVVWDLGLTRTSSDFAAHLRRVVRHFRDWHQVTWVVDNLNTHWSLEVCEVLAAVNGRSFWPRALKTGRQRRAFLSAEGYPYRFVFTPKHGSWLNQVELWFSVLARRFLRRGDFSSPAEFEARLRRFLDDYNEHQAHPYRWTYTGEPLVRGTPFSQTRRQQRRGRAWSSPRPAHWQCALYPPRPYRRSEQKLAANL